MSINPKYLNLYLLNLVISIFVFVSIFSVDTLSDFRFVFDKNIEYLTFICIREEQGTINLFKSFLSMTSDYYNITNDALKLFNSISVTNF
jgi:hypothetical protein